MLIIRIYLTLTFFCSIIVLKIRISEFKEKIVEKFGIIKEFDALGRLVIPKELRERYGLKSGVEIVATREGVLLKSPEYILTKNPLAIVANEQSPYA